MPDRRARWLRLAGLAGALAVAFVLAVVAFGRDAGAVRDAVEDLGAAGPVAYVALLTALTVALFPYPVAAAAGGLLFGVAEGTAYAVLGGVLGAVVAFELARRLGRTPVDGLAGPRLRALLDGVGRRGFAAVLLLRVVPGVPRDAANFLCGLTSVGLVPFTAATAIGLAPRAYAYVALGGSLGDLGSTQSLVAVGLLVAMALLGIILLLRDPELSPVRRRGRRP